MRPARADLPDARAGPRRGAADPGPRRPAGTAEEGYLHCGPAGAGHFVKMIHNGIEYGLMQAYAEGFDILRGAAGAGVREELRYDLDLAEIAELWRRGSVVTSWLLDLTAAALAEDPRLAGFTGAVADSGEGRWTVKPRSTEAVPADGAHRGALRALPLAPGAHLRREGAVGDAARVRRPRRGAAAHGRDATVRRSERTRRESARRAPAPS